MGLDISHSKPTMKSDSALDYFTLEDLKGNPDFIESHKNLVAQIEGDEDELIDILYFDDAGYQRKQMNVNFFRDFECGVPYFDIETVKKAMSYIEANDKKEQAELIQIFQREMIKKKIFNKKMIKF